MSSLPIQKQQYRQQHAARHRINDNILQQSRNTNAYFDREQNNRHKLMTNRDNYYWDKEFRNGFYMKNYYQHRNIYSSSSQRTRKSQQIKYDHQQYKSKLNFSSSSSSNNYHSYHDKTRIGTSRHHQQHQEKIDKRDQNSSSLKEIQTNQQQLTKPRKSTSTSSTNSDVSNHIESTNRKDLHTKNLAAAALAARQQNPQAQTNLSLIQTLMNSLILQQQQQPAQSHSTIQLQYQLTNALLATMIQQRFKEAALQAQAQQIQAALPTLLAAQALVHQQQQQINSQSVLPPNVAHPGTKFNNRPLVKFPIVRSPLPCTLTPNMSIPIVRPSISYHRNGINTQQTLSTTHLPTYQQVQEMERGSTLDDAIHIKGSIDIKNKTNLNE